MKTIKLARQAIGDKRLKLGDHAVVTTQQLERFAALVAERCAQLVRDGTDDAERYSGAEAAGHLDAAADRILAEFPKP